jgi:hypothetical protein
LRGASQRMHACRVSLEGLVSREELAVILFAVHDINVKLSKIIRLLEGEDDGEGWPQQDDA